MPDIDLDFPRDIREVLIPEVHRRYGADRSALVAAFPTYRPRGAVRDLGKALGLPPGEIERVARMVGFHGEAGEVEGHIRAAVGAERAASSRWRALAMLCAEAMGLPRHPSQHPGGMVISTRPLIDVCPVVPAAMEGRQTVQWDKDSCADAGFLKIDLLGLGMLSAVERCVVEIERVRGKRVDLSRIPHDDAETFDSIRAAETTGVFQIESRAQMQMLPRTLPADLDDLTVQVALVRPGPIQGGAIHPYIERRKRLREDPSFEVPYEHPLLEPVLRETLGTIVFQEQVIEVAMELAGFSSSEAEGLRRAMSRKRSEEAIRAHHERFVAGAGAARRAGRGRRAGLAPDPGLLRLRVSEGALGGVRPARLPVGLAAGPLRPRVPLRAAERAADGLLPARLARPRGAAARGPGRAPRRRAQRRPLPGRARARRPDRPHRARLREGGSRGGDGGAGRRARARWPLHRHRRPRDPLGRRPRRARAAGLGRCPRRPAAGSPRGLLAARGRRGPAAGGRGTPAAAAARAAAGARARGPRPLGDDGRELSLDRDQPRRAPALAAARRPRRGGPPQLRAGAGRGRLDGRGRRHGRRPPAARDGEGDHLHAARRRARDDQPDRPAAGLRAQPLAGPRRAAAARPRPARAPRRGDQRDRRRARRPRAPRPSRRGSHRPRPTRAAAPANAPSPRSGPSPPPATASAGAGARPCPSSSSRARRRVSSKPSGSIPNGSAPLGSVTTVAVRQSLDQGPRDLGVDRRHQAQPERGERRAQQRHRELQPRLPSPSRSPSGRACRHR